MFKIFDKNKTFRPKKGFSKGTRRYELHKHAKATLGSGNLRTAVSLPEREDLNEWLAVNTVDFFNQINLLYGSITEFCTPKTCEVMSAGPKYEYLWADGENVKRPIKVSAPDYVDYLMTWVQNILDDETIFPSRVDVPFPKNFQSVVKQIFKRLFRVYAHIYYSHFHKKLCRWARRRISTHVSSISITSSLNSAWWTKRSSFPYKTSSITSPRKTK